MKISWTKHINNSLQIYSIYRRNFTVKGGENVELEVGKTYSTQQFIKALDISQSTWDRNREKYLDNLRIYYDFEVIYRGRRKFYKIVKKLGDYRKPPNKRSKEIRDEVCSCFGSCADSQ